MTKTKAGTLAPRLRAMLDPDGDLGMPPDCSEAKELRALLAVARCAEADLENVGPRSGILDSPCTTGKLARALARLSRVSRTR